MDYSLEENPSGSTWKKSQQIVILKFFEISEFDPCIDIERRLDIFCVIENVTLPVGNL